MSERDGRLTVDGDQAHGGAGLTGAGGDGVG